MILLVESSGPCNGDGTNGKSGSAGPIRLPAKKQCPACDGRRLVVSVSCADCGECFDVAAGGILQWRLPFGREHSERRP